MLPNSRSKSKTRSNRRYNSTTTSSKRTTLANKNDNQPPRKKQRTRVIICHSDRHVCTKTLPVKMKNYHLITLVVTSDYQKRIQWGWMGFDNASWKKDNWEDLLYPNMCVDVNHKPDTISGYIVNIKSMSSSCMRKQADWPEARPMGVVLATFVLPPKSLAGRTAADSWANEGWIASSIDHGGRKPNRTIGPFITVSTTPKNPEAMAICGRIDGVFHNMCGDNVPKDVQKVARKLWQEAANLLA